MDTDEKDDIKIMEDIRSKAFESMVARHGINYRNVERALPIVEQFIIKNKLVIYGGMAMDMAFQLKGSYLYDPKDDVLPDFDFYSPDAINHAYQLADILHKAGFENVNAINALHVTTMKVRLGNDTVADISYVPPNIFQILPTLKFKKFTVLHPMFQRIDMHESLTEPFRDPPREVVFHRFAKDIKRFKMIEKMYPIIVPSHKMPDLVKTTLPNLVDVLFVGYASYAAHYYQLLNLIKRTKMNKDSIVQNMLKEIEPLEIWVQDQVLWITIPRSEPVGIYTDDYESVVHSLSISRKLKATYYNTFLDRSRPRMVALGGMYEIYDNKRSIKTYVPIDITTTQEGKRGGTFKDFKAASIQLTMMYFIQRFFEHQNPFFLHFYQSTLNMAKLSDYIIGTLPEKKQELEMNSSSMYICTHWFGKYNLGDAFGISMQYMVAGIEGVQLGQLRARSYWPAEMKKHPDGNIKNMPLYQIDGKETEPFKPVGDGWYEKVKIK